MSNTLPEINVEQVKTYNNTLREYTEKGAGLKAELTYVTSELTKLCEELSAELNMQVTVDNIEQIYMERVSKVENTLKTGEEILQRIRDAEASQSGNQPVAPNEIPGGQVNQGVIQQGAPQFEELRQPQPQATIPGIPGMGANQGNVPQFGELPGMFSKIEI